MRVAEMHWEFKDRFNKLNSNQRPDLLPVQIDARLNSAVQFFLEFFAEVSNIAFEDSQQRLDMLSTLVVKNEPVKFPDVSVGARHEYRISNFSYPYAHMARAYLLCEGKSVPVSFKKGGHDKLSHSLNDAFQRPSTLWKRALGVMGMNTEDSTRSSVFVYTDKTTPEGVYFEYIRKPQEIFFGGYDSVAYLDCVRKEEDNCDTLYLSSSSDPQDCDLPIHYHDLVVDIAVYLASGKTENVALMQILKDKIVTIT